MIRRRFFIYMQPQRFVFACVPKAASTNWKALLRQMLGHADYLDCTLAHDRKRSGLTYLSEVAAWQEILENPAVAKYAFVRNPFSRVLSAYLNKVEPLTHESGEWLGPGYRQLYREIDAYARASLKVDLPVSFATFLFWLKLSGQRGTEDAHWLPQVEILSPTEIQYDFLGRFEKLEQDSAALMREIGCQVPFPTREAIDFPATDAQQKLRDYYTDKEAELVREIYARDFEAFGYPLDLPFS